MIDLPLDAVHVGLSVNPYNDDDGVRLLLSRLPALPPLLPASENPIPLDVLKVPGTPSREP
jgi:hypothetical protein